MIQVNQLSKNFGNFEAVKDLSFEIPEGSITGFLGPNGAGKSTTMRLLTGFIPPSSGSATIAGFDVTTQSQQVRAKIGYLPESAPLYKEMTPRRFLKFRASLRSLPKSKVKSRIEEVASLCQILDVLDVQIGVLSKGYRQRVALSDALFHDPDVLILDEPTVGLDPNQIVETRGLIKSLKEKHTIILSTHILSEVEAVCDQVVIINKGKLVAVDTPKNLLSSVQGIQPLLCECKGRTVELLSEIKKLSGVESVSETVEEGWAQITVNIKQSERTIDDVFSVIRNSKLSVRSFMQKPATLEDIFIHKTYQGGVDHE